MFENMINVGNNLCHYEDFRLLVNILFIICSCVVWFLICPYTPSWFLLDPKMHWVGLAHCFKIIICCYMLLYNIQMV